MIDTIVIRLHDLTIHKEIYDYLSNPNFSTIHKSKRVIDFLELKHLTPLVQQDYIQFGDSGSEVTLGLRGKFHIESSHYYVAFNIENQKDYIEFNFSIPKFFYGNNIAQFVRPVTEKKFIRGIDYLWRTQAEALYDRLMIAIGRFFKERFIDMLVDYSLVEVNRIDICYNQIFQDKREAFRYLNYQKLMNLRNMRINGNRFQNRDTSMMYVGDHYSVKVYHKGSEYRKNDRVKHEKINQLILKANVPEHLRHQGYKEIETEFQGRKGTGLDISVKDFKQNIDIIKASRNKTKLFDTEHLQRFADKILRYEMTFHKAKISKVYKDKVFRKDDSEYQRARNQFKEWWNISHSGVDVSKIPKQHRIQYDYMLKFNRKVIEARLTLEKGKWYRNVSGGINHLNKVNEYKFDKDTLSALLGVFRRFFMEFQVKYADCEETFMNKLLRYNEEADIEREMNKERKKAGLTPFERKKTKKNTFRMRSLYQALMKYGSWECLKKSGEFNEATYHRYKKEFKELGFEKNYISRDPFVISTDFDLYYDHELQFIKKLRVVFN